MEDFWKAFNSSTLIQGVLACTLTGGVVYLAVTHQTVPEVLGAGFSMMLGYFFAAKGILTGRDLTIKALTGAIASDPRIDGLIDQARDTRDVT